IVGCDANPLGYYRRKHDMELLVRGSPAPSSLVRATQFHPLVATVSRGLTLGPLGLAVRGLGFQPCDPEFVASHLVRVALGPPRGRTCPDRTWSPGAARMPRGWPAGTDRGGADQCAAAGQSRAARTLSGVVVSGRETSGEMLTSWPAGSATALTVAARTCPETGVTQTDAAPVTDRVATESAATATVSLATCPAWLTEVTVTTAGRPTEASCTSLVTPGAGSSAAPARPRTGAVAVVQARSEGPAAVE